MSNRMIGNASKNKLLIGIIAIMLVLGIKIVVELRQEAQQERQIEFLKKHEKEIAEFIKKYSSKDEKVTFVWNTVKTETLVAFSKPMLTVMFNISDSSKAIYNDKGYVLRIETDVNKLDKIDVLMVLNEPISSNIQEQMSTTKK